MLLVLGWCCAPQGAQAGFRRSTLDYAWHPLVLAWVPTWRRFRASVPCIYTEQTQDVFLLLLTQCSNQSLWTDLPRLVRLGVELLFLHPWRGRRRCDSRIESETVVFLRETEVHTPDV